MSNVCKSIFFTILLATFQKYKFFHLISYNLRTFHNGLTFLMKFVQKNLLNNPGNGKYFLLRIEFQVSVQDVRKHFIERLQSGNLQFALAQLVAYLPGSC